MVLLGKQTFSIVSCPKLHGSFTRERKMLTSFYLALDDCVYENQVNTV